MKTNSEQFRLDAVTDRAWTGRQTLYEQVEEALRGGITFLQLREKQLAREQLVEEARQLKQLCEQYQVPFVINDSVEVAMAVDADGVHLGQEDGSVKEARRMLGADKWIGVSAHNVEEAINAENSGADYLGVGAVFPTTSKQDVTPLSRDTIRAITDAVQIPVVAIGGICEENVGQLQGTGIDGIAVIRGIFGQEDIAGATRALRKSVEQIVE